MDLAVSKSQQDTRPSGLTTGTLSQLERGISNPSWGTLKAIAKALGISMVELAKLAAKLES